MTLLDRIVASTKERVDREKQAGLLPLNPCSRRPFLFEESLHTPDISFICEIKKASPSKGIIAEDFPYSNIAQAYEQGGADAISILTEPDYFQGDSRYLADIRGIVDIPLLRKDFIIDAFQITQSAHLGADAILLICAILTPSQLAHYIKAADKLGLSCLVETHDKNEITMALDAGARIIGVNNRNLKTFEVNMENSLRLRTMIPKDILFVSESGIRTPEDIDILREHGIDAVLIGETLMRSSDKGAALRLLRGMSGTGRTGATGPTRTTGGKQYE